MLEFRSLSKTFKKVGEIATSNESQKRSSNFKTFSVSTFAGDLEMNEQETALLGCHNKGSWRHVFYKVRSELTRLVGSSHNVGLPQTIICFDDGKRRRTKVLRLISFSKPRRLAADCNCHCPLGTKLNYADCNCHLILLRFVIAALL
uniref:Uncharacterized protein n=1 Tax=Davidia involucrata TaxID=16924 RepID=A0A5B7B4Z6_DAVIN